MRGFKDALGGLSEPAELPEQTRTTNASTAPRQTSEPRVPVG